jgi:UDP-3-O-[3-hydroxymyristoyl] N-acetylglucosamine deacetylase/3-hydroxyacyl-[acyl-carrier-protein] dehydratase
VGDLSLLGPSLKAHVIAVRPGHALNSQLTLRLLERLEETRKGKKARVAKKTKALIQPEETTLDIRRVLDVLPHRYPFVLIDRVIEMDGENSLVAIKNVTINEPFFAGHFPGRPVMPGVLQIEAMAQAAGILMLKRTSSAGKVAFFMSCDKVKFRRAVEPGDQLVIRVSLEKVRGDRIASAKGECRVGDKVVSSAELMFSLIDAQEQT